MLNLDPPTDQVYHPNIDLDGNVCLNILREDWKPVLSINSIIYGLQYLFLVGALPWERWPVLEPCPCCCWSRALAADGAVPGLAGRQA